MRTALSIPKIARRDFSIYGDVEYPRWSNVHTLTEGNPFPFRAGRDVYGSPTATEKFARAYVTYSQPAKMATLSDVRLVKNGQIVGGNLLTVPKTLGGGDMYNHGYYGGVADIGSPHNGSTISFDSTVEVSPPDNAGLGKSVKVVTTNGDSGIRLVDEHIGTLGTMPLVSGDDVYVRVRVKSATAGSLKLTDTTLSYSTGWVSVPANKWVTLSVRVQATGSINLNPIVVRQNAGTFWVAGFEVYRNPKTEFVIPAPEGIDPTSKVFGLALSFTLGTIGVSEHIVISDFGFSLLPDSTIDDLKIVLESANSLEFLPPGYPSVIKLFNTKVSVGYTPSPAGMVLFGSGSSRSYLKPDGYEYNTKALDRTYQYMVYANGTFLGELNDVSKDPSVRTALNSFPSDITIEVGRNADSDYYDTEPLEIVDDGEPEPLVTERNETIDTTGDAVKSFGEGTIVDVNNNVDIYEYHGNYEGFVLDDGEPLLFDDLNEMETPIGSPEGRVYFSGYISKYDLTYGKSAKKTSKITLLSHTDEYNNIVLEKTDEDFLAISNDSNPYYAGIGKDPGPYPAVEAIGVAQTVIFSGEKILSTVYAKVQRWGGADIPPSQYPVVNLEIRKGNPADNGQLVATATASISSGTPYWQAFSLPVDIKLAAGQRYSLLFYPGDPMQGNWQSMYPPTRFFAAYDYGDGSAYYKRGQRGKVGLVSGDWVNEPAFDVQIRLSTRGGDTLVPMFSVDPSDIFKRIVDYGESRGSNVRYLDNSITPSNTVVSAKYNMQTLKEALDATIGYTPTDWYWYIDQSDLTLYLNKRSEEVSHVFTLGKEIEELKLEKSMEDLVNEVYFTGGQATVAVPLPYENKYAQGEGNSALRVTSQMFLPEPGIEYKIFADYPSKSCEVIIRTYSNGSSTPDAGGTFMESGKLTFRYDPAIMPNLTGICVVAKTTDNTAMTPSSTTLSMVSDTNVYRHLVNQESQAKYRKALVKKTDQRVTNAVSADIIANAEMERNPAPIHAATLTVLRDEYLKNVTPGQMVAFRGFGNFIDHLQLIVMEVTLDRGIMTLNLGAFAPKTSKRLEDLKRNLQMLEAANNPSAPTSGVII